METSLHRQLKESYAAGGGAVEVVLGAYRIDAVGDGELIEIQHGSLSAIRPKIQQLLRRYTVRIVKPIIARKRIIRQTRSEGPITSRRWSPRRGHMLELFDELVYFAKVFPHPRLVIDVPLVEVEEWRMPPSKTQRRRRRAPKHRVKDLILTDIVQQQEFRTADDLLRLIDTEQLTAEFDTAALAALIDRPRWVAQRIAYVLRETGAATVVGRRGNALQYQLTPAPPAARPPRAAKRRRPVAEAA